MENADLHKSLIVTVRLRKAVLQFCFLAQTRQAQVSHILELCWQLVNVTLPDTHFN